MKVAIDFFQIVINILVTGLFEFLAHCKGNRVHPFSKHVISLGGFQLVLDLVIEFSFVILPFLVYIVLPPLVLFQSLLEDATLLAVTAPHLHQMIRTRTKNHLLFGLIDKGNIVYLLVVGFYLYFLFHRRGGHQVRKAILRKIMGI